MKIEFKKCLLCERLTKVKPIETYKKYTLFECQECHLLFWEPLEYFPEYYEKAYQGLITIPDSFKFAQYHKNFLKLKKKKISLIFIVTREKF